MKMRAFVLSAAALAMMGIYFAGYRQGMSRRVPCVVETVRASDDGDVLLARDLAMPLENVKRSDILDTFSQARAGGKKHEATDIMAARGTPIHAVEGGIIQKLFLSKAGGNTIYEFDPQGIYCFYYAHLDRYSDGLREGMQVKKGDLIGYVGSTGDASPDAPHLHFAIVKLGPDKKWWEGTYINPYPILIAILQR